MRCETVEQYKILNYIEADFDFDKFDIEFPADDEVTLIDSTGARITFTILNNEVVEKR